MRTETCRGCGSGGLELVLSLGEQPLANALTAAPDEPSDRYPLELAVCSACALAQLTVSVDPELLFHDYVYFSSFSPTVVANAAALVERLVVDRGLGPDDLVLEVASNDGYLLRRYVERGIPVLGVDPARNIAAVAEKAGVPTRCDFFGTEVAGELAAEGRRASILHANNVLAHVPDVNDLVAGMARVLRDDGIAVVETPYLRDLVEQVEFDTIYHEHVYYYSLTSLEALFRRNGLVLLDVERIPIHGGSLRLTAARGGEATPAVATMLAEEADLGMAGLDYYRDFAARVDELRVRLRDFLADLDVAGRRVAGYGAAAKTTVMLNFLGEGPVIEFVADRSPHKQGRFVPGVGVPIVAAEELLARQPDDCVIFAWNFADEIVRQQATFLRRGGRFVVPVPEPRLIPDRAP